MGLPESFAAPGNNLVQLRRISTTPAPSDVATDVKDYLSAALTTDSRYTVALKSVDHFGANQYLAYEFLVWRNAEHRETTRVLFNVTATGSFADFFKDVPFTVTDGANTAAGEVNVPVHSLDPAPQCQVVAAPTRTEPLPVFLSGDTDYTLSLDCSAAASVPRLVSLRGPEAGHRQYWKRIAFESEYWGANGPTRAVTTRSFDLLKATLTPNVLAAVGARLRRLNAKGSPDDTIVFDLTYAMPPGGFEIPMKIEIPVVFFPFVQVIVGALGSGVALGWGAAWLLLLLGGRSKPKGAVAGALLLGLLLAVFAFAVALLAYSANCRLQVFGLDLNPSDVVVLFLLGLACGWIALLKSEELRRLLNRTVQGLLKRGGAASACLAFLFAGTWCVPASAAEGRLALVGLAACPGGDVIGLHRNGTVIRFSGASRGTFRPVGRLSSRLEAIELACATLAGRETAFVLAVAERQIRVVRMDLASGRWRDHAVASGVGSGIAFDPASQSVFLSSPRDRTIYRISAALEDPGPWASIFGPAESIGPLAVDEGRRLLVGEAFSGIVYSLALDSRRQATFAKDIGVVNSLGIDHRHGRVYVADSGHRTIWAVPMAGTDAGTPRPFYRSDELEGVTGVAPDGRSNVWVGVYMPAEVIVLDAGGRRLDVMR